jgi:hypothetical protein
VSGVNYSYWGVQFETGSYPTAFTTASGTLQGELSLCQRYYNRLYQMPDANNNYGATCYGTGFIYDANNARILVNLPTTMRIIPATTTSNINNATIFYNGTKTVQGNISSISVVNNNSLNVNICYLNINVTGNLFTSAIGQMTSLNAFISSATSSYSPFYIEFYADLPF